MITIGTEGAILCVERREFGTPRPHNAGAPRDSRRGYDYFGAPLDEPRNHDPIFYRWDLDKRVLNSWALVSKHVITESDLTCSPTAKSSRHPPSFGPSPNTRMPSSHTPDFYTSAAHAAQKKSSGSSSCLHRSWLDFRRFSDHSFRTCGVCVSKGVCLIRSRLWG